MNSKIWCIIWITILFSNFFLRFNIYRILFRSKNSRTSTKQAIFKRNLRANCMICQIRWNVLRREVIDVIDRLDIKNQKKVFSGIHYPDHSILDWFSFFFCLRDMSPIINMATTNIANPGLILNPASKFELKLLVTELLDCTSSNAEKFPAPSIKAFNRPKMFRE